MIGGAHSGANLFTKACASVRREDKYGMQGNFASMAFPNEIMRKPQIDGPIARNPIDKLAQN